MKALNEKKSLTLLGPEIRVAQNDTRHFPHERKGSHYLHFVQVIPRDDLEVSIESWNRLL